MPAAPTAALPGTPRMDGPPMLRGILFAWCHLPGPDDRLCDTLEGFTVNHIVLRADGHFTFLSPFIKLNTPLSLPFLDCDSRL